MAALKGSVTTTGRSGAIRIDKAFFQLHPEFRQRAKVAVHPVGPGHVLVSVIDDDSDGGAEADDPMVAAFLAFLERDTTAHPERIVPLSSSRIEEAVELTRGVAVDPDEEPPDDVTL